MPKPIKLGRGKEFNFTTTSGGGGAAKYPWDQWLNGDLLLLEQSFGTKDEKGTVSTISDKRDYEVDTDAMPPKLKTAARRRYKVVQISRRDAEGNKLVDSLIIKARDMTDDERQAEDILRAEEKVEMAETKKAKKQKAMTTKEAVAASNAQIDKNNGS